MTEAAISWFLDNQQLVQQYATQFVIALSFIEAAGWTALGFMVYEAGR